MAGVNNVSTYDNATENSHNTFEHTNITDDSNDKNDSLIHNVIETEVTTNLNEFGNPVNRVKCSVDIMLATESIHSATVKQSDDMEYTDLKSLKSNEYQLQKDASELLLLTETQHIENTSDTKDMGFDSEIVSEVNLKSDTDNDCPLSDNTSSGFEGGVTKEVVDQEDACAELEEPRVFTRPLPVDETDNVTELVFDTWTTVDEVVPGFEIKKIETNGYEEKSTLDISIASPNHECFDTNIPAITNKFVSFCLIIINIFIALKTVNFTFLN